MNRVLVLSSTKKPLMPCHPARARQLLKKGRAKVYRMYPFTIILTDREDGNTQETRIKIDPGSRYTGLAIVANFQKGNTVVFAAELRHRGHIIKRLLDKRRAVRRNRRNRKTRYRKARFNNRSIPKGWLPPSVRSRIDNIITWVKRFSWLIPILAISLEHVKFDTQKLSNPDISGIQYQQGTLFGYEIREYLLEKFEHKCAYCGKSNVPLEIEHIVPKSRGGTNRIDNLTIACHKCNQKKGNKTAAEFGYPNIQNIQKQANHSLRDTAAVNSMRWALYEKLKGFGLDIELGTGGRTKYNRTKQGYLKDHWVDAACVGKSGENVLIPNWISPLIIIASGRGSRQVCRVDKYGFPRSKPKKHKIIHGFQTGDIVKAIVPRGKYKGTWLGKVMVRKSGSFSIKTKHQTIDGINYRYCQILQRVDGYAYEQ